MAVDAPRAGWGGVRLGASAILAFGAALWLLGATDPAGERPARPGVDAAKLAGTPKAHSVASEVRAGLPKFDPHGSVETAKPIPEGATLMPKVKVFGERTPTFTQRQIDTRSEFSALLRKEFPGASTKWQDPYRIDGHVFNYAALMYSEQKRKRDQTSLMDFADRIGKTGDHAGEKELKNEIEDTFVRRGDWTTESMDRSANDDRR
ncbi:hypothetical protein GALL_138670 [mine drainage metagenome]|uniref:Uncharacterized protein n=1 Tax=mine drainage metagenome TaxID=410659 RepID=A0A1J5SJB3_9ZZZZ